MDVITILVFGKRGQDASLLSEKQLAHETQRPGRKALEGFVHHNAFKA